MTRSAPGVWVCIVDGRRARLLHAQRTERGDWRFECTDSTPNKWTDFHERGHASAIAGERAGGADMHAGLRTLAPGHEADEMRSRWARDVAAFLAEKAAARRVERLTVFAPPAALGALRGALPPALAPIARTVAEDLAHVEPKDAAAHPAIAALLPARA